MNKENNTRKRKPNHQPIFPTPTYSQFSPGTNLDLPSIRPVLADVSNINPNGESTQQLTHPSNVFSSSNPNYGVISSPQIVLCFSGLTNLMDNCNSIFFFCINLQIKLKESCHRVLRDCVQLTEGLVSQTNQ